MSTESLGEHTISVPLESIFSSSTFLNSFTDGILLQDLGGLVVDANMAASELLGVSREQLLGHSSFDERWHAVREDGTPFPGDEHPASLTLRTRQPMSGVVMGVQPPEHKFTWIKIDTYPIEVAGHFIGISSLFYDVTPEVLTRQELRVKTEQFDIVTRYPGDLTSSRP